MRSAGVDIKLVSPSLSDKESFLRGLHEFVKISEQYAWIYMGDSADLDFPKENFQGYVEALLQREIKAPPGFVTDTVFWAKIDNEVVGRISIRHELNDFLKNIGGHIGYIVRPNWRGKGVASEMLRQVLLTDRAKKIKNILLTCDETNVASEKTILKNGGILEGTLNVGKDKPKKKRYWIYTGL